MPRSDSVTEWIAALKTGDSEAARQLWNRYFGRLLGAARKRFGAAPRKIADEEDVAISVFHSLCLGAEQGHFATLTDRVDLWQLLLRISRQKTVDHIRWQTRLKRGKGEQRGESAFRDQNDSPQGIDEAIFSQLTPDYLISMEEELQRLLDLLRDDTLRQIAILRMDGHSNDEIGRTLRVSTRTIERKLRLIRQHWKAELEDVQNKS